MTNAPLKEFGINQIVADALGINYYLNVAQFTPKAELINDLGADSLDLLEIQLELESSLNIELPELPYHTSLHDLYQLVPPA